ncbi:MAG TPA: DUF2807 domain-containing protein, partial [Cellvibrionaceae bacterium]
MQTFKSFLIAAVLALWANVALANDTSRTETFENVRAFSFIGEIDVTLVQGSDEKLVISGDADVLKKAELSTKKGELTLESDSGFWGFLKSTEQTRISATLTVRQLEKLQPTGAIVLNAEALSGKTLHLKSTGANQVRFTQLDIERLNLSQTGAGQVTIGQFTGEQLRVELSGASKLWADSLQAEEHAFGLSGASEIKVGNLNGEHIQADFSGASFLTITGTGEVRSQNIKLSGSGGYKARELQSATARVDASGATTIELWASSELDAKLTGSSTLRYRG